MELCIPFVHRSGPNEGRAVQAHVEFEYDAECGASNIAVLIERRNGSLRDVTKWLSGNTMDNIAERVERVVERARC